jgi:hypothetical protein
MSKPKAILWLEDQTGQNIDYTPEVSSGQDRHLSVRLTNELSSGLEMIAIERGVTVSKLVRELLSEAVERRASVGTLSRPTRRIGIDITPWLAEIALDQAHWDRYHAMVGRNRAHAN